MSTLKAVYVRLKDASALALLRARYPTAFSEPGLEFYGIEQASFEPLKLEVELCGLSREFDTDVIWLVFQSVVDAFQFHHWRSGRLLRSLVYGCWSERTWERIEGEPEAWEREAIFGTDPVSLDWEWAEEAEAERLRRSQRSLEIQPGDGEPSISAGEMAEYVASYYRLPGWS